MSYYYQKSGDIYNICFTDGVFDVTEYKVSDENMAAEITELLQRIYDAGRKDGANEFYKERFPDLYFAEVSDSVKKFREKVKNGTYSSVGCGDKGELIIDDNGLRIKKV